MRIEVFRRGIEAREQRHRPAHQGNAGEPLTALVREVGHLLRCHHAVIEPTSPW
jgi:hypothetical protein